MCGPQIRLCLFTFRPIASKQLNRLTTIDTLSWLCSAEVTHPLMVHEVMGSIPSSGNGFLCLIFFILLFLIFVPKHYLSQKFAIPFSMLIYLVYMYLTHCKICDRF